MTAIHDIEFKYRTGEEVVFRLEGADVASPPHDPPEWSIGEVLGEAQIAGGRPRYRIRFRHRGDDYEALVPEHAIEGTA